MVYTSSTCTSHQKEFAKERRRGHARNSTVISHSDCIIFDARIKMEETVEAGTRGPMDYPLERIRSPYKAEKATELSVDAGDLVYIVDETSSDKWIYGQKAEGASGNVVKRN